MVQLQRIWKDKVINHHHDVPYKVLNKSYTFGEENSWNKIIHGDNLEALKSLLPQYEWSIDIIYIDPPYNTGNEWWKYNDNVNDPKIKKWLNETVKKEWEDLSRHDKWLCMMYPRLKLLQKLLSKSWAIFISIDDNELTNLKSLCDEIFWPYNFVWLMTLMSNPRWSQNSNYLSYIHEYVLMYAKNKDELQTKWVDKDEESLSEFKEVDPDWRRYRLLWLRKRWWEWRKEDRPNMFYSIYVNPKNWECSLENSDIYTIEVIPKRPTWELSRRTWSKEKFLSEKEKLIGKKINRKSEKEERDIFRKDYIDDETWEEKKTKLKTIRTEKEINYQNARNELKELFWTSDIFDYPKPTYLVSRLISIMVKNENSIILDSFAWSWTTWHAIMNLNEKDWWKRKYILIEMMDYAETITAGRMKKVIDKKWIWWFDFYELWEQLFIDNEYINENIWIDKIRNYIRYSETKSEKQNIEKNNKYYLWTKYDTDYYFFYEKDNITVLDINFLSTIKEKNEQMVIYADKCLLSKELMNKYWIIFKKIPRDIAKNFN